MMSEIESSKGYCYTQMETTTPKRGGGARGTYIKNHFMMIKQEC